MNDKAHPQVVDYDAEYPEHAKLKKISDKSQAIGEFLDWCNQEGLRLGRYVMADNGMERLMETGDCTESLLALYFGIDLNELEKEKQCMLEKLRAAQQRWRR